jgi:hypothetical protein
MAVDKPADAVCRRFMASFGPWSAARSTNRDAIERGADLQCLWECADIRSAMQGERRSPIRDVARARGPSRVARCDATVIELQNASLNRALSP